MAFNINPGKQQFSATAAQTVFTFNFAIFAGTDIKVYKTLAGAVANDTTDLLTIATHYTVSINGTLGGTVTLLSGASLNDTITIVRVLPITRSTDYVTNGDLYADTLDLDQDYQTYLTADADVQLQRAIIVPESLSGVSLSIPAPIADTYLRWNVTATALENDATIPQKLIDATTQAGIATTQAGIATTQAGIATTQAGLASTSATNAQLRAWEAEAERLTADRYATEAEDVPVNIVTSAGDGTFIYTPTSPTEYSSLHWSIKALGNSNVAGAINNATAKTIPVDADLFGIVDSAASNVLKKLSWLNVKATLKTYFDTLYSSIGSGGSKIQPITASVAANALTVTLNATSLDFRSGTIGSGTVNTRTIASPISMTVSSGSTLGTVNAIASRLVLIAIDNAGTVELAIVNLAGGNNLDETTLISTTAEGGAGAADSASVIYSTTARTNVPFRVVGFIDITEATAGTWATDPSEIQGAGGEALTNSLVKSLFNAVGSAPLYACRAWVNFNGTGTVAIRSSGNVSSITDNGVGDYTVNLTTAMLDANYAILGAGYGVTDINVSNVTAPTTTAIRLLSIRTNTGAVEDSAYVNIALIR